MTEASTSTRAGASRVDVLALARVFRVESGAGGQMGGIEAGSGFTKTVS